MGSRAGSLKRGSLATTLRIAFGTLLVYAACMKLGYWHEATGYVRLSMHASEWLSEAVVSVVVVAEVLLGGATVFMVRSTWPLKGGIVLMLAFTTWSMLLAIAGHAVPCRCFGAAEFLLEGRWGHLLRNVGFLLLGVAALGMRHDRDGS